MPAAVVKDGTVTPKFRQNFARENFASFLNGEIFPAKFSPGEIPPPCTLHCHNVSKGIFF